MKNTFIITLHHTNPKVILNILYKSKKKKKIIRFYITHKTRYKLNEDIMVTKQEDFYSSTMPYNIFKCGTVTNYENY